MQYKKPLLVAGAVTTLGLAGFGGLGVASAATDTPSTDKPGASSIIDKLATKFHIDRNEVKAVFEQDRADHEAEHEQQVKNELSQAVTEGKLTETQKQAILDKITEIQSQRDTEEPDLQNKTEDELRAMKQQFLKDMQDWAAANNIPQEYLGYVFGGPGHHKDAAGMSDAQKPADDDRLKPTGATAETN